MSYQHEHTPVYDPIDGYNTIAPIYHTYHKKLTARDYPMVSRYLPRSLRGSHVLDLGGGDGRRAGLLQAKQVGSRTIVDVSQGMLDRAPSWTTPICHDIREPLMLEDHAYDLIMCTFVLGHLDEIETTLSEAKRCLAPSGRLMIVHHHERRPYIHHTDSGEIKIKTRHRRHEDIETILQDAGWQVDIFTIDPATNLFCCFAE